MNIEVLDPVRCLGYFLLIDISSRENRTVR
jgi:hypothetical protein